MKFYKTILTLLAITLAVIGTTATVVYADEPETPTETTANIDDFMDEATGRLYQELSDQGKAMATQVWGNITTTAPQEARQTILQQFIASFHENEGSAVGGAIGANSCTVYTGVAMASGYAAAHTGNSCTKAYLRVDLQVQGGGPGSLNSCSDCRSTFASVSFSSCNYYVVRAWHEWGYPTDSDSNTTDNYAACE